jgi:hypothetical protein
LSEQTTAQQNEEIFALLAAPFRDEEVRSRNQGGRTLYYITASTVANRLDDVLGPAGWEFDLTPWGDDALFGTLSIRLPDGSVVRKMNVGGCADMAEGDNDAKSAASDALKRCAALLGVGRYLYGCGVPPFVENFLKINIADHMPKGNGGGSYQQRSSPPPRQQEYDDRQQGREAVNRQFSPSGNGGGGGRYDPNDVPSRGAALIGWAMKRKDAGDWDPIDAINAAQKERGFPKMLKEWSDEQVAEVRRQILGPANGGGSSRPAPAASRPSNAPAPAPNGYDYNPNDPADESDLPF